jgi:hypothetical protein
MAALHEDMTADEAGVVRLAGNPVSPRFLLSPFSWVAYSIALLADLDPTVCVELCKIRRTRVHMIALVLGSFRR